jgi:hypothetical protein
MKRFKVLNLIVCTVIFLTNNLSAQIGYYDAPYTRYEADLGTLNNATVIPKSYKQTDLQCEASDQTCVSLTSAGASVAWTVSAAGDGLVVRYSVPDGQSGALEIYADNVLVGTLNLTTYYSWEYLSSNGNPNNVGVVNTSPRMRFDEVRMQLPSQIASGGNLKLVWQSGTIALDFAELEAVPASVSSSPGDVVYGGNGSDLQTIINANGGKTIYLPAGVYNVPGELYFGVDNTVLKGAGMWFTEIHFTGGAGQPGGLTADANNISYSDLYLSTVRNSRANSYKSINGVYTSSSTITNVWAEHFECGAWLGQYNNTGGPLAADGLTMSNCRFRNNYADGINLCKGTSNAIVEHCSFRNNGDDDMAIWSSNGQECQNNTFQYNTSENCWRSSGCAIYGGYNNVAQHLLIKDNLEVGLRVNNSFSGAPFNSAGMHLFSDITVIGGGTFNDLYNNPVGAIDISCTNIAGTGVNNVKFSNITLTNSKNDAIYIYKKSGNGFYNLVFENITVNGTGEEYPYNNAKGLNWGRGYGILFIGSPLGYGTYCNMTYSNIGGNASSTINNAQIGSFSWTNAGCGTYVTSPLNGTVFGECGPPITITAAASTVNGSVDSVEFFIDGIKVGGDVSLPYSYSWNNSTPGNHKVYVKSTHAPSGNTILSSTIDISVEYIKGLVYTSTPPVIDGSIDALWTGYTAASLDKLAVGSFTGAADLSATYQINYDATNLYLLVDVTDNILVNIGGSHWNNDALEVFIDIGNTKSSNYEANDYAYNFVYNDPTVYENQHNATSGVTFAQSIKSGGYIMEISIPWSTLGTGTAPGYGSLLGFDIHVDDNDNGVARHAKKTWNDCADISWKDPAAFGTLQESGCTAYLSTGFINFQGTIINGPPSLQWDTYYKSDDSHFDVLRDATGSGIFQTIATVNASGSPGVLSSLSYTDYSVPTGQISYRISRVDVNGCKTLSEIINLGFVTGVNHTYNPEPECIFYPNPFITSGNLQINPGNADNYSVSIKDMSGKLISTKTLTGSGPHLIGGNLPSGMYILEVLDGINKQTIKLIKL